MSVYGYNRKGFTFIEILIVISLVSILAFLTLKLISPVDLIRRGNDTAREAAAVELVTALDKFKALFGCNAWEYSRNDNGCTNLLASNVADPRGVKIVPITFTPDDPGPYLPGYKNDWFHELSKQNLLSSNFPVESKPIRDGYLFLTEHQIPTGAHTYNGNTSICFEAESPRLRAELAATSTGWDIYGENLSTKCGPGNSYTGGLGTDTTACYKCIQ